MFIRENALLKGTKFKCLEGGCGACIVNATFPHPATGKKISKGVNACLVPVLACHGWAITSVEGVGGKFKGYHKIQKRLTAASGTQCGYCSPGMVMNMYSLLQENPKITMKEIENAFGGNICRCTGYRPILDAFKSLASDATEDLVKPLQDMEEAMCSPSAECQGCCSSCNADEDLDMIVSDQPLIMALKDSTEWYRPANKKELFQVLDMIGNKKYRFIAGNTAQGVYRIKDKPQVYIDIKGISETHQHSMAKDGLTIGGSVPLGEAMMIFYQTYKTNDNFKHLKEVADGLDHVANIPVRNIGTIGGSLMLKHQRKDFYSDVFILFEAAKAQIIIDDKSGSKKKISLMEFLEMNMSKKLLSKIVFPPLDSKTYCYRSYKVANRAQNAHSIVHGCFLMKVDANMRYKVLEKPNILFCGISSKFVHASKTEEFLVGRQLLNPNTIQKALSILSGEVEPDYKPPDASPEFRKGLAESLLYKFILSLSPNDVTEKYRSGGDMMERPLSRGDQKYDINKSMWPIGQPMPKLEALKQVAGELEYSNDIPQQAGEVWGQLVLSDRGSATINRIDASEALKMPGVVAFYSAKDIPGQNTFCPLGMFLFPTMEELFAEGNTSYAGQPIGIILAETHDQAIMAAKKVKVSYGRQDKIMIDLKQIVDKNVKSRINLFNKIEAKEKKTNVKEKVTGTFEVKAQYHFSMEPLTAVSVPKGDFLEIYSSAQWLTGVQEAVTNVLNIPQNKVVVKTMAIGGGFGEKITPMLLVGAASGLAAWLSHRPVRLVLEMRTAMKFIGKRSPMFVKYTAEVDGNGAIQSLDMDSYQDTGYSANDNYFILGFNHITSMYDASTWNYNGYSITSDLASNTWVRAPGSLESISLAETIMDHIAKVVKKDPIDVRRANLIPGDEAALTMLAEIEQSAEYQKRKSEIEEFNQMNRWKKRGIAVTGNRYPFGVYFHYQASVSIMRLDGTVQVVHGFVEMGQGINTKGAAVVAHELGIPIDLVQIMATDTVSCPNNSVTGGCMGSDNAAVVLKKCCAELNERLAPIKEELGPKASWKDIIAKAYEKELNLKSFQMIANGDGQVQPYGVYGAGVSEVEVDILTGQAMVRRVDLVVDAGESMSPLVDIGQAEGSFIFGLGYYTTENIVYNNNGVLKTNRSWDYKPPGPKDIPVDFRVYMRKNLSGEPSGMYRSKITGEPPLCASISIPLAIRNALESARKDAGQMVDPWFDMNMPCNPENVWKAAMNSRAAYKL